MVSANYKRRAAVRAESAVPEFPTVRLIRGISPADVFARLFPMLISTTIAVFAVLLHHPLIAAAVFVLGFVCSLFLTLAAPLEPAQAQSSSDFEDVYSGWSKARGSNFSDKASLELHRASRRRPANEDSASTHRGTLFFD